VHFARRALDLGKLFDGIQQGLLQRRGIPARLGDQPGDALVLEQRQQQVLRLDVLLVATKGRALRLRERLLQLRREFFESHALDP
jgi:hypothetical protein